MQKIYILSLLENKFGELRMKDKYIENLILNNSKYCEKYENNKEFHNAVEQYSQDGCAEIVIKLLDKLT